MNGDDTIIDDDATPATEDVSPFARGEDDDPQSHMDAALAHTTEVT